MSRSEAGAGWRRWTLVWLAVMACPGMACQSTRAARAPESARGSEECPARLLAPQASLTYTLTCDGMTPRAQRLEAGAKVTFVSKCERPVTLSFSQPETLFVSGRQVVVLKTESEQTEETVSKTPGCHQTCFDSATCPPEDDRDAKTGSLDVYTSGGSEPTPSGR